MRNHRAGRGVEEPNHDELRRMILVVDDDSSVRATIVRALTALGYAVCEAPDGRRALEIVREEALSLVILDYIMPGMDGADVAREIGSIDAELPIIFSTGHAALRALRSAAGEDVSILEKPFTLDELDALVHERVTERRRARIA
jgi:two-component system response regulator (stage 0 sporulation protein F)